MALKELKDQISENALHMWIETLEPVAYENDAAVMLAPSQFQRDIVMSKYKDMICAALQEVAGFEMSLDVIIEEERKGHLPASVARKTPAPVEEEMEQLTKSIAHPDFTFDTFIVGDSNRHAHAACFAVAQNPSGAYNPLFLHGASGLGKTHLLFAVENEIRRSFPQKKILYVSCEDFIIELTESIKRNNTTEFKNKYRSLDVLIVDDIQFISGKEATQTEFFNTFDALYTANKQIVLASDRPPRDIPMLAERLRSRFESGVITDISQPEYELKAAIIRQRCQFYGMNLSDDVIAFIAQNVKSNIRQIEGVLKKMMAYRMISHSTPNMAIAQSAIKDITNENQPLPVIIDKILSEVSRDYELSIDEICSQKRTARVKNARQVAMYLMRELTPMSLPEIGKQFGDRDHSTVHHSIRRVEDLLEDSPSFRLHLDDLIEAIRS